MTKPQPTLFSGEKLKTFPLKSGTRKDAHSHHYYSNIVLEVLVTTVREEKEIKRVEIWKEEVKLSLFADDMTLYIENPKDASRKLLELINEFRKVTG